MTMNRDGSRTIRAVDLVSYAEEEVRARIADQARTIEELLAENSRLRSETNMIADLKRVLRFRAELQRVIDAYEDGSEFPGEKASR